MIIICFWQNVLKLTENSIKENLLFPTLYNNFYILEFAMSWRYNRVVIFVKCVRLLHFGLFYLCKINSHDFLYQTKDSWALWRLQIKLHACNLVQRNSQCQKKGIVAATVGPLTPLTKLHKIVCYCLVCLLYHSFLSS